MKRYISGLILLLMLLVIEIPLPAVETESSDLDALADYIYSPIRIKTVQRGNFQGILRDVDEQWVEIIARDGQILFIDRPSIESYTIFDPVLEKNAFFQDSASNRLIVMPTAFPMETGEFHVANQEIAAFSMSYGLNDSVSFWSGISIPGLLLNARYSTALSSEFAVSFGSFAGFSWFADSLDSIPAVVIPYGIASWGEENNNFTIGAGPIFLFNQEWDMPGFVLVAGGKKVLTSTTSLVFENWISWGLREDFHPMNPIPYTEDDDDDPSSSLYDKKWSAVPVMIFPAVCFRIANERLSWDIGIVVPLTISNTDYIREDDTHYWENGDFEINGIADDFIIPIPLISVTYRID